MSNNHKYIKKQTTASKRARSAGVTYKICNTFNNYQELKKFLIETEKNVWSRRRRRRKKNYIIEEYTCKFKRKKAFKCQNRLIVEINEKINIINIKKSVGEHNHWEKCDITLSNEKKRIICECGDLNISPALIQDRLKMAFGPNVPDLKQIQNLLYRHKTRNCKPSNIKLIEIQQYISICSNASTSDSPYVIGFSSTYIDNAEQFCIVWSTPNLIKLQLRSAYIQIDSNLKIDWREFSLITIGFTNTMLEFYGTYVALISSDCLWCYQQFFQIIYNSNKYIPSLLLGNANQLITEAAQSVWNGIKISICFFYVLETFKSNLKKINIKIKNKLCIDISILQGAQSEIEFQTASNYLIKHWRSNYEDNQSVLEICEYFIKEWILSSNNGWYNGYLPTPIFNNRLEVRTFILRQYYIMRQKFSFNEFANELELTLKKWSENSDYKKVIAVQPTITQKLYEDAFALSYEERIIHELQYANIYVLTSSNASPLTYLSNIYNNMQSLNYNSWEAYINLRSSFHIIKRSFCWSNYYCCSCFNNLKNNICKHAIMIMCKLNVCQYPNKILLKPVQLNNRKCSQKKREFSPLPNPNIDDDSTKITNSKKFRSIGVIYSICNIFSTENELKYFLIYLEDNVWSKRRRRDSKDGIIEEYVCKFSRRENVKCSQRLIVEQSHANNLIVVKRSAGSHNHF